MKRRERQGIKKELKAGKRDREIRKGRRELTREKNEAGRKVKSGMEGSIRDKRKGKM